jgi:sulfatase maturation enzyme AslB (radical SAM superfamily)
VKNILRYFSSRNHDKLPLFVQLTGGEVFFYEGIFEVVQEALNLGYCVRIQTNGTLLRKLSADELDILRNPKVVLKVSLDGWDEKTHGKYRDPHTFSEVISGLEVLKQIGARFGLKTVVHEGNFSELERMLDLSLSVGARGWSYNTLMQEGRGKDPCVINEMAVTKKLIPFYNQQHYKSMLNGSNVLVYYQFNKQGKTSWPPYIYFNFDGTFCVTEKVVPERILGRVLTGDDGEIESGLAGLDDVLSVLERPMSLDIMDYVSRHLEL